MRISIADGKSNWAAWCVQCWRLPFVPSRNDWWDQFAQERKGWLRSKCAITSRAHSWWAKAYQKDYRHCFWFPNLPPIWWQRKAIQRPVNLRCRISGCRTFERNGWSRLQRLLDETVKHDGWRIWNCRQQWIIFGGILCGAFAYLVRSFGPAGKRLWRINIFAFFGK